MRTTTAKAWLVLGAIAAALTASVGTAGAAQSLSKTLERTLTGYLTACPSSKTSQPFAAWGDSAPYALIPGGSFESAPAGWSLAGGARAVAGNESFFLNSAKDAISLALPAGSAATTPTFCVSIGTPTFRLVVRNVGDPASTLGIDVGRVGSTGITWSKTVTVSAGAAWQPTPVLSLGIPFWDLSAEGTADVVLRFTPQGAAASWQIDDVYLDPFKR